MTVEQHGASWVRAEAEAHERQHAAEWERVHEQLGGLAKRRAKLDAEEAHLLRYAEEIKLWRGFGCGSMMEYLQRRLGYKPHTAARADRSTTHGRRSGFALLSDSCTLMLRPAH